MKYNDKDEQGHGFDIPNMYKVPYVKLDEQERGSTGSVTDRLGGWSGNRRTRNSKQLYVVSFKCSRVDIFYLLENTGLDIKEGDIVIVEADRGQDLGT